MTYTPRGARKTNIREAIRILQEYDYQISLRHLFYRFVSEHIIENNEASYNKWRKDITTARLRGLISWGAFVDGSRSVEICRDTAFYDPSSFFESYKEDYENAESIFKNTSDNYDLPFWYAQPYYIEVWSEKDAITSVLLPICKKYRVSYAALRGNPSLSFIYEARQRFDDIQDRRGLIILYTDHDPSGFDISRDVEEKMFSCEVVRHAITEDQITKYDIPPIPEKRSNPHTKQFVQEHGPNSSVELDAIPHKELADILEQDILSYWSLEAQQHRTDTLQEARKQIRTEIDDYFEG